MKIRLKPGVNLKKETYYADTCGYRYKLLKGVNFSLKLGGSRGGNVHKSVVNDFWVQQGDFAIEPILCSICFSVTLSCQRAFSIIYYISNYVLIQTSSDVHLKCSQRGCAYPYPLNPPCLAESESPRPHERKWQIEDTSHMFSDPDVHHRGKQFKHAQPSSPHLAPTEFSLLITSHILGRKIVYDHLAYRGGVVCRTDLKPPNHCKEGLFPAGTAMRPIRKSDANTIDNLELRRQMRAFG